MFVLRRFYCVCACVCVCVCVMDTICWRRARIRSLIGRFHFGSEFQSETKVNIRHPNQIDKGYLSGQFALAFTQVFAISLFLVARRLSDTWPCLKASNKPAHAPKQNYSLGTVWRGHQPVFNEGTTAPGIPGKPPDCQGQSLFQGSMQGTLTGRAKRCVDSWRRRKI